MPTIFKKFKVHACDIGMNLDTIFEIEKSILNRCSWKINMSTAIEIKNIIQTNNLISQMDDYEEIVQTWINFSLFDYAIYQNYDHFTLSASCILIACNCYEIDYAFVTNILEELQADKVQIDNCMALILNRLNQGRPVVIEPLLVDVSLDSMDETRETVECKQNSDASTSNSPNSSFADVNTFDQIPVDNNILFDNIIDVDKIQIETNYCRIKGRKKIKIIKSKRISVFKGKMKKNGKNRKIKYNFERRLRYSRDVKKEFIYLEFN